MPGRYAVALFVAVTGGCGISGPARSKAQFERAKALWTSTRVPDYSYTLQRVCFCASVDPVRIAVVGGQVASRTNITTNQPVPAAEAPLYPNIDGLFAIVEDAFNRASSISATFDPVNGIPLSAVIDYVSSAIDDELTLSASNYTARAP